MSYLTKSKLRGTGYFHFKDFYNMLAEEAPAGATVVEIGVLHGHSLVYLKKARPDLDLIGVDWGRGVPDYIPKPTANTLIENLVREKLEIPILLGDSSSMARFVPSAWAVFIDGDHTEDGVRRDIAAWEPTVMPGGILGGDDYGMAGWPDVKKVVDELYPEANIWGTTWWVRK